MPYTTDITPGGSYPTQDPVIHPSGGGGGGSLDPKPSSQGGGSTPKPTQNSGTLDFSYYWDSVTDFVSDIFTGDLDIDGSPDDQISPAFIPDAEVKAGDTVVSGSSSTGNVTTQQASDFPWWLLIVAAAGVGYYVYTDKPKSKRRR